jgi:hypothetical protein
MHLGINNLSTVITFGLSIGQKIGDSLEDGRLDLMESLEFVGEVKKIPDVITAIKKAPEEIADLDMEEQEELYRMIQEEFDLANDKVERAIEIGLRATLNLVGTVNEIRELFPNKAA